MLRIGVTNNKGGVGKTTVATHVAREFAKRLRVLLVDMDPQCNATNDLAQSDNDRDYPVTIANVLELEINKSIDISDNFLTYIENGNIIDNLKFFPSSRRLSTVEQAIQGHAKRERKLAKALKKVEHLFDVVVIDCPPQTGTLLHNVAEYADVFICPVTTDKKTWHGIQTTIDAINPVKEDGFELFILRNMIKPKAQGNSKLNEFLFDQKPIGRDAYDDLVLNTCIRERESFRKVTEKGRGLIHAFDSGHPVMNDLSDLAKELLEKIESGD